MHIVRTRIINEQTVCILGVSAENWNTKYVTALLPGLSNMLLGCEIGRPSHDSPTWNQYMQGWVLPMVDTATCNGPL